MILSNGVSSPVFAADGVNTQGLQSFEIPDYSMVKRVKGTQLGWVHSLSFSKKDGTKILKVELHK